MSDDLVLYICFLLIMTSFLLLGQVFPTKNSTIRKAILSEKNMKDAIWYISHEVYVVGETKNAYKIKRWKFMPAKWVPKNAIGIKLEII